MQRVTRALALLGALCLLAAPARAEAWEKKLGGSGEERIRAAVPAGDGLFAVGYTYSTDGDLSMRKRGGQTGWTMRLDADGEILWNYCSAHVGRNVMTNPYAHSDGTFSCVLYAENEGSEWLRLDADGKLLTRIEVPEGGRLCPHEESARAYSGIPCQRDGAAQLAVICEHADGSFCCALLTQQGEISFGAPFDYGSDWVVRPLPDDSGRIAFLHTVDGGAQVLFVAPGSGEAPRIAQVPMALGELEWVLDAVAGQDGSVTFSGQLSKPAGVIARVSGEGEVLFCIETDDCPMLLTMTDEGFAGATSSQLLFYDEDGGLVGAQDVDELYLAQTMASVGGGMLLLRSESGAKTRQIHLRFVEGGEQAGLDMALGGAFYAREGAALLGAQSAAGGVCLLIALEDGSQQALFVDAAGKSSDGGAALEPAREGILPLPDGEIRLEEVFGGVLVTRVNAQGEALWQTRTMIHTAADRLQWRCAAQLSDGSILLGGRYLTGSGGGATQQAAIARLSADGVLREMRAEEELGCVCAMLGDGEDALLLASRGKWATSDAQTLVRLSGLGDASSWQRLSLGVGQENAFLIAGADGQLYVAGTYQKNGAQAAVLLRAQ